MCSQTKDIQKTSVRYHLESPSKPKKKIELSYFEGNFSAPSIIPYLSANVVFSLALLFPTNGIPIVLGGRGICCLRSRFVYQQNLGWIIAPLHNNFVTLMGPCNSVSYHKMWLLMICLNCFKVQQIFIEYQLCTRYWVRYWGFHSEQNQTQL